MRLNRLLFFGILIVLCGHLSEAGSKSQIEVQATRRIVNIFAAGERGDSSRKEAIKNIDLNYWSQESSKLFHGSQTVSAHAKTAVLVYLVNSWTVMVDLPRRKMIENVNHWSAQLALTKEEKDQIINSGVRFEIRNLTGDSDNEVKISIQLWPKETKSDPEAQVSFVMVRVNNEIKIKDADVGGGMFLKTFLDGLRPFAAGPEKLTQLLISKGLVRATQLNEYAGL